LSYAAPVPAQAAGQKLVVAYLPGYATSSKRNYSIDDAPGFLTHLIYSFAGLHDNGANPPTVTTAEPKDATKNFVKLEAFHQRYPNTNVMISIGGWNNSHVDQESGNPEPTPLFAKIAADPVWRTAFVKSALDTFIRRSPSLFDGIDLDWEFPTTDADKANFILLAKEFRQQLDAQGAADGHAYLFSIAISVATNPPEIDLVAVAPFVNFFNVMSYNYHGARGTPGGDLTNFENPLQSPPSDPTPGANVDATVKGLLASGVAPEKFVLGITSNAHSYAGVSPTNDGLYQSYSGPGPKTYAAAGILTFKDVRANYLPKCSAHVIGAWHSSWLYCATDQVFISYESVEEVREKAVYVDKMSLGGIMLWELGADDNAMLLAEVNRVMNKGCAVGAQSDACGYAVCNDGTCQPGLVTSCANPSRPVCTNACAGRGGVNASLGCVQTP
jgi:chitinase